MTQRLPHLLRSDARDNRDRVLDAARALFAERGLDVPMRAVAARAGVGPATLYRRFPTRQHLVEAAFVDEIATCAAIVAEGCADPDPWRGLCSVIERITELNARNQGFVDAFLAVGPNLAAIAAHRRSMLRQLTGLARRAQDAGHLRADFVLDDLILMLLAGHGLATIPPRQRAGAACRLAALTIEAFRASVSNGELPPRTRLAAQAMATGR